MDQAKRKDNRRVIKIAGHIGIYRIEVHNEDKNRWSAPKRGGKFQAVKPGPPGHKPIKMTFGSFEEAKVWRLSRDFSFLNQRTTELPALPALSTSPVSSVSNLVIPSAFMTFGELATVWERDWLPHKDVSTRVRYRSYLSHFKFFWNMRVDQLEPHHIDAWIAFMKRPEYLESCHSTRLSYDHEFSVLRGILRYYASRFNRSYRLPFLPDHKAMLKIKEKQEQAKDLTVEEFKKFLKALRAIVFETRWEVVYYIALMQYLIYGRVQDAAALHHEDFDFLRKKILVRRKVQWVRAKGHVDKIVDGAKTNGGKEIPMAELAAQIYREWALKSGSRSGRLFSFDGEIVRYRTISYYYDKALKVAGLPYSGTHLLRHASLTEHYDTCSDLKRTARVAGHGNTRSTERYTKVRDDRMVETQREMDVKLEGLLK